MSKRQPLMIFVGYVPDINSGGNSMIPYIIKQINKVFNKNKVYFYILFNRVFDSENEMYIEMNKYNDTYLPIATNDIINNKENIFIYPENCGNPLNAKKIVRFNFYFNTYEPSLNNEYNVCFASPYYKLYNKLRTKMSISNNIELNNTNTFHKYINSFYNLEHLLKNCKDYGHKREGSCYTLRKGCIHPHFRDKFNLHPLNSFAIEHHMTNGNTIINIFNKYTYFYSYDGFTNLVQMASLCGCIPIIIPFWDFMSLSEIFEEKWWTNGVAYGDSEEQISFALSTRHILIEELEKLNNTITYDNLFIELVESIYNFFNVSEYDASIINVINTDNMVIDALLTSNEQHIIVYKLMEYIDNNKILILTDKINDNNFSNKENFELSYVNYDDIDLIHMLDSKKYNYLFSHKKINHNNYRTKTYFVLNLERIPGIFYDKIKIVPYKYCEPHFVNEYQIMTWINLNNNYNITIEPYIYDYRPNNGSSKIIWAPSWDNISNSHWIIQTINTIGFNHYKRKTNLIDVVCTTNEEQKKTFLNDIKNPLNICIYQENQFNPLSMDKCVYFNWFYDSFRNKSEHNIGSLYLYQFPFYSIFENILRQRYDLLIDINTTNEYPNCFPCCFNVQAFLSLYKTTINSDSDKICYVLRKTQDSHPLKFVHSVKDYFIHPEDSTCIDEFSLEENIAMFLKCKTFYCYDNTTFLPVIASLCGCNPILMNNYPGIKNIREIYKLYSPWMYYGMSYYNEDNSITDGSNTRHLLFDLLKNIVNANYKNFFSEQSSYNSILTFLQYLECYFKVSFNE